MRSPGKRWQVSKCLMFSVEFVVKVVTKEKQIVCDQSHYKQLGCNNTLYHRPQREVFCSCLFIFPTADEQRRSQVAIYFTAFFHTLAPFSFYLAFSVHWSWYCHPSNVCLNYQELPQIVYLNMWNFVFIAWNTGYKKDWRFYFDILKGLLSDAV